ncbi:MAG TPA: hypothetical protein PLT46_11210, partial [Burkholderiaceae bacterium]|nr:hypothetical protein [Burkholderiaceae bacterium]
MSIAGAFKRAYWARRKPDGERLGNRRGHPCFEGHGRRLAAIRWIVISIRQDIPHALQDLHQRPHP